MENGDRNMRGNEKIGVTAELVAVMRSEHDKKYKYFTSKGARVLYGACRALFPRLTRQVFDWRILLSREFDRISSKYTQVIDLAAGYSLRNFEKALGNKEAVCIDADLEGIVNHKREIIRSLCRDEGISFPENFQMMDIDLVREKISNKIKINKNKRTAIFAEGLVTYLNEEQFNFFIDNVSGFLRKYPKSAFYFNLNLANPDFRGYGWLRAFVKFISKNESYSHFSSSSEIEKYFYERDLNVKVNDKNGLIICKVWV